MNPRVTSNPIAEQHEQRHGAALDEIHRLIAGYEYGCVCMPQGIRQTRSGKWRRASNAECKYAEISLFADLQFDLEVENVCQTAAESLEAFAKDICELADHIRRNGKAMNKLKVRAGA